MRYDFVVSCIRNCGVTTVSVYNRCVCGDLHIFDMSGSSPMLVAIMFLSNSCLDRTHDSVLRCG